MKRIFKRFFFLLSFFFVLFLFLGVGIFIHGMYDKMHNPFVVYRESKFHASGRDFLVKAFENIPSAKTGQSAVVLAAEIAEQDLIFPLRKGYHVQAVDYQTIYYDFMPPEDDIYKDKISHISANLTPPLDEIPDKFNFSSFAKDCDLMMASFILPFYDPKHFPHMMKSIQNCLKPGGYFIGNFLGPETTLFHNVKKEINYLTKDEILELFANFKIIELKESKKPHDKLKGIEHLIEVFAVKNKND